MRACKFRRHDKEWTAPSRFLRRVCSVAFLIKYSLKRGALSEFKQQFQRFWLRRSFVELAVCPLSIPRCVAL